ncbi:MAG: hypothetical protein ACRDWV_05965 [Acidimicrobiales bacterium]
MMQRWLGPRALGLHLVVLIWAPGCIVAGIWQVNVALSGLRLAWVYSIEWPAFALLGIAVWYHLIVDDRSTTGREGLRKARQAAGLVDVPVAERVAAVRRPELEDERLAAYNDYLASLAASGRRKTVRHP